MQESANRMKGPRPCYDNCNVFCDPDRSVAEIDYIVIERKSNVGKNQNDKNGQAAQAVFQD